MKFIPRLTAAVLVALTVCHANPYYHKEKNSNNETYLFPTNASRKINSGFADYRASHFHGGIDISTNAKIGYPVYAAKSGYVYRVSVSPFGYGKRIVLRHDDSTYTLYGHLSGFNDELASNVKAAQQQSGKYGVDLRFQPNEIRVTRGEVIAYTGATGVGGPHLHFEIHDRNYGFVDPLIYRSIDVGGYLKPRIFDVAVREFNSGNAEVSRVRRIRNGYYAVKEFHLNGPFYFVIHAGDSYGSGRFKRPPKHISLKVDDKKSISLDLTHFAADDYLDVSSLVDMKLSRGYKTYYKLCVDRAIPFSVFTPDTSLAGLIDRHLSNGLHDYSISVKDEDGNTATVSGKFDLQIPRMKQVSGKSSNKDVPIILPFTGETFNPLPGLTVTFPANCFVRNEDIVVSRTSPNSFKIEPAKLPLRKQVEVVWKVDDPNLRLYRKLGTRWSYVSCRNDDGVLSANITY